MLLLLRLLLLMIALNARSIALFLLAINSGFWYRTRQLSCVNNERGSQKTTLLFLSVEKKNFCSRLTVLSLSFSGEKRVVFLFFFFFCLSLSPPLQKLDFQRLKPTARNEAQLSKKLLEKFFTHTHAHIAYITHISLSFQKVRKLRAKVTDSFSHAEYIRERFSNVVLASFDSRLSSLVLRARLEKEKF